MVDLTRMFTRKPRPTKETVEKTDTELSQARRKLKVENERLSLLIQQMKATQLNVD